MVERCVACGDIIPEGRQICPVCNREYDEAPALSRKDNQSKICPECGMMEALDSARHMIGKDLSDEAWEKYKRNFLEKFRRGGTHG